MESISCRILSFKSSRDRGRCLKTFSFRYPQRKKSQGRFDRTRSVYGTLCASLSQNGCSRNMLKQQSPDVHRSNPLWVLKTVEANQPHGTTPTSLPLLQPAQCPLEMWEIFMFHPVGSLYFDICILCTYKPEHWTLQNALRHWGDRMGLERREDKLRERPIVLRKRRERIKSEANWSLFYYKFTQDHALPNLIWNHKVSAASCVYVF